MENLHFRSLPIGRGLDARLYYVAQKLSAGAAFLIFRVGNTDCLLFYQYEQASVELCNAVFILFVGNAAFQRTAVAADGWMLPGTEYGRGRIRDGVRSDAGWVQEGHNGGFSP